jgi:hypothetical protein
VKGIGGASYVVAAGSVREDGSYYAVDDSWPVQDIPDWLVDWLCEDFIKFVAGKEAAKQKKFTNQSALRAKYTSEERRTLRAQNNPDGFLIAAEDTRDYLVSLAFYLTHAGLSEALIQENLIAQAKDICRDGEAYVSDEHNKLSIAKTSQSAASAVTVDVAARFYSKKSKKYASRGLKLTVPSLQHNALVEVMCALTYPLDGAEACQILKNGIVGLEKLKPAAFRNACMRARDEAGVEVKPLGNGRFLWKKENQGDIDE